MEKEIDELNRSIDEAIRLANAALSGSEYDDSEFDRQVKAQLESCAGSFRRTSKDTYVGISFELGCGPSTITIITDEDTDTCQFVIETGIYVSADILTDAYKYLNRLEARFKTIGLVIDEDRQVVYQPFPCLMSAGGGVEFELHFYSFIRRECLMKDLPALEAGLPVWKLL